MAPAHLITSEKLSQFKELRFAMSTRAGGTSQPPLDMNLSYNVGDDPASVTENRKRLFASLGLDHEHLAFPRQCHSNTVKLALDPGEYESCDALVTGRAGLPLVVTVADCLPIVLFDFRHNSLALIHAGW
jgi:copper oxidase (laccase) domain-containing protein